jgi:hypothetical protein
MTDPFQLNRLIQTIVQRELARADHWGDGIAAVVEGSYASVRKGDPLAEPTPGFFVAPDLVVREGDHVWFYDDGGFKLIVKVLSRNALGVVAGDWAPFFTFATPGNLVAVHSVQEGHWRRMGDLVWWMARLTTSTFTFTTASGNLRVAGLPAQALVDTEGVAALSGWTKAGWTQVNSVVRGGTDYMELHLSGSGQAMLQVTNVESPTTSALVLRASGLYLAAPEA